MFSAWVNKAIAALREVCLHRFASIGTKTVSASMVSEAVGSPKKSSIALWRLAIVLFAAVICVQVWWPVSLTAQSQTGTGQGNSSNVRRVENGAKRPPTNPAAAVTRYSGTPSRNRSPQVQASPTEGQPRRIPNSDLQVRPVNQVEQSRANRSNRVAQAELQQEQPTEAAETHREPEAPAFPVGQFINTDQVLSPQGLKSSLGVGLAVTVLSLAPAILMMSTCFVRFIVVLSLLRQALGTPNLPPNQVLMGLSLCLTFLVMAPVWNESYQQGIRPYVEAKSNDTRPNLPDVFEKTVAPLRRFMSHQIEKSNNADSVWMFIEYQRPAKNSPEFEAWHEPQTYDEIPLTVLLPAYLLSELKTAFLIGFQIYLPFLIIDLVVASVLMSMGLSMLSPAQISLPFKLLLFVLIDGWTLTVGMLIESVRLAG
jgi:flagellar biosynthetic protein FliP